MSFPACSSSWSPDGSWTPYQSWGSLTHLLWPAFLASSSSQLVTSQWAELSGTRPGKTKDLPGQSSEAWVETDQKFIVTNVRSVPADFANGPNPENLEPPHTCCPHLSYLPRCKGRRRAPRWARRFQPFCPPGSEWQRSRGPTSQARVGQESPSTLGRGRRHTHTLPEEGPAQSSPSSQSLHSGLSARSLRPPASGSANPREGRPFPSSRPQSGEVSQPAGVARAPTCEQEASGVRPLEPDPPSLGGTWAPGTAGRSCAYMFVQRRLHLAASLISGCGLR